MKQEFIIGFTGYSKEDVLIVAADRHAMIRAVAGKPDFLNNGG